MSADNPFFQTSTLPYEAPRFDDIELRHYRPAFDKAIRLKREELAVIISDVRPPDFENTCLALELSGRMLSRVSAVFYAMSAAHTNDTIQGLEEGISAELAALNDDIYLNDVLYARLHSVWLQRDYLMIDEESLRLLDIYHQRFVLAGAGLSTENKEALRALNTTAARLMSRFNRSLLVAMKTGGIAVNEPASLEGLSDISRAAAAQAARDKGETGWYLTLMNTTQQPALQELSHRPTRERLFYASLQRCERADSHDTRDIVLQLAHIRARQAALLGYDCYASWSIADQMAKTRQAALDFMRGIVPAATARFNAELAEIQDAIRLDGFNFQASGWDWLYYSERVRQRRYALDEAQIRPYFELNRVLTDGVFYCAEELYGVSFVERFDLPVYQEDVRVWEVFDENGCGIALFYGDFLARDSKSGGAWMGNFIEQSTLFQQRPVIYNVCNFAPVPKGKPALLSWDDTVTLFHEFGHALHGIFARQRYASLSGTNTPRDFVEFPSQINEYWASYPEVFTHYARHYQDGSAMPQALREKLFDAALFNKGYDMTELLAAAILDMRWHSLSAGDVINDVNTFENAVLSEEALAIKAVPPRYRSSYFSHIWGGGYAAGYYAYLWTQMLADDGFKWFEEQGGLTRDNGRRFQEAILSKGNSAELSEAYRKWRGRAPDITAMLRRRGLDQ